MQEENSERSRKCKVVQTINNHRLLLRYTAKFCFSIEEKKEEKEEEEEEKEEEKGEITCIHSKAIETELHV